MWGYWVPDLVLKGARIDCRGGGYSGRWDFVEPTAQVGEAMPPGPLSSPDAPLLTFAESTSQALVQHRHECTGGLQAAGVRLPDHASLSAIHRAQAAHRLPIVSSA